ncbi:MAG: hypothetical protein IKP43_07985, partial [Bacteroidaceae bacterium]|nr:hypothetical protein [Bacteroidaceae bacterium]
MRTRILCLFVGVFLMAQTFAQDTISLAGKWEFATNQNAVGHNGPKNDVNATPSLSSRIKFDDSILLPASMPERDKGDEVTAETRWVGSLYDSSYYFNPYMKKYRER